MVSAATTQPLTPLRMFLGASAEATIAATSLTIRAVGVGVNCFAVLAAIEICQRVAFKIFELDPLGIGAGILRRLDSDGNKKNWFEDKILEIFHVDIRPFARLSKDKNNKDYAINNKRLALYFVTLCAASLVLTEFSNLISGEAPGIYNRVLPFMGPIRMDTKSAFETIPQNISEIRNLFA